MCDLLFDFDSGKKRKKVKCFKCHFKTIKSVIKNSLQNKDNIRKQFNNLVNFELMTKHILYSFIYGPNSRSWHVVHTRVCCACFSYTTQQEIDLKIRCCKSNFIDIPVLSLIVNYRSGIFLFYLVIPRLHHFLWEFEYFAMFHELQTGTPVVLIFCVKLFYHSLVIFYFNQSIPRF